jgi:3-phosphoshikimate 1-carboxyvinyltransferase
LSAKEYLSISGDEKKTISGSIHLPPSKSYAHRALFIASLCNGVSKVENCSRDSSDDVKATVQCLKAFGIGIESTKDGRALIVKSDGKVLSSKKPVNVGGSGTTARFAISLAALAEDGGSTKIVGDASLSNRPMKGLLGALSELGARCRSEKEDGNLPVVVRGDGIPGGRCRVDGSVSSQFISSLLIACTRAKKDSVIQILSPSTVVSEPYIDATLQVLKYFGFEVKLDRSLAMMKFEVKGNQLLDGRNFKVPGDMSSAASLMAVAIACHGNLTLAGIDSTLPQSDSAFLKIANQFGAEVMESGDTVSLDATKLDSNPAPSTSAPLILDLRNSPDLVPIVAAVAAALAAREIKMENIAHLKLKESDRLKVIEREFGKLGIPAKATNDSLSISPSATSRADAQTGAPIRLDPENDHRILMALAIAALSGRFGDVLISEPSSVRKSYPNFIQDLQSLLHDKKSVRLVKDKGST